MNTPLTPRPAATVMMIRDGATELSVFLMRRHRGMDFAGGVMVFPGGGVDDRDRNADLEGLGAWAGPPPAWWAQRFGIEADLAEALVSRTPGIELRLALGAGPAEGHTSFDEFVGGHPAVPLPVEREGSAMLYSSGTTGQPKGIRRPLSGHPFGSDAVLAPMLSGLMGFAEGDVYLPFKLDVLRTGGGLIAEITTFDASLFDRFGLPPALPATAGADIT